jgi:hypothetical protein
MKAAAWVFAVTLISVSMLAALGQLQLKGHDRVPDESANETYSQRFSLGNAITCTKQIDRALRSFVMLTKLSKKKLTEAEVRRVGNTESDIQTLGFQNWVGAVEGTLRKQNYQIAKLEYELAVAQRKTGSVSASTLKQKQTAYRKAEKDFKGFWNRFGIAD